MSRHKWQTKHVTLCYIDKQKIGNLNAEMLKKNRRKPEQASEASLRGLSEFTKKNNPNTHAQ